MMAPAQPTIQQQQQVYTMKIKFADVEEEKEIKIAVHPEWAPLGAKRFADLVSANFYEGCKFFRVIDGFMAQFGINANPIVNKQWRNQTLMDDAVATSNTKGTITFATSGPNSRTTQLFINLVDNSNLDSMGFAPFGEVIFGFDDFAKLIHVTGEGQPQGEGPSQSEIQEKGNKYLDDNFPDLTSIVSVSLDAPGATPLNPAFKGGEQLPPPKGW
eukprot:g6522.t1